MKKIINCSILALALTLTGCGKDFLTTEPSQFISADQIAEATKLNPNLQNANIRGLYSTMITAGSGGTSRHDDFGDKGWDIYADMLSGDMVLAGYTYGWYQYICEYTSTVDFTTTACYMPWRYFYRIILGANYVIDGFGGNDAVLDTPEARHIYGQAKALRAYAYFYLANYYGQGAYTPGQAIIPLYTEPNTPAAPKSTMQEVYDLIIDDLTQASELLVDFERTSRNQINAGVAKGLLAYAYAAVGDYAKVKQITDEIITTGNYDLMTDAQLLSGFNDVTTTDWMWGQDITLANGLDLVSWWGQMDIYTYSYAWAGDPKSINSELYAAIPADDVRKGQFVDVYGDGQYLPTNKFFDEDRVIGGQREITSDYIYMRVEEMYLLNAEAAAKTGDEAMAKQRLIDLLEIRLPDASYVNSLTGQALLDEIYFQTRVELWGEGKIYLAKKRLHKTITLPSNHLTFPGEVISYEDNRMTLDIPESEVINNPEI